MVKFFQFVTVPGSISPSTSLKYLLEVVFPVYDTVGTEPRVYGSVLTGGVVLANCIGDMRVGSLAYEREMSVSGLRFALADSGALSNFRFSFKSLSDRDYFYSTSTIELKLGFLSNVVTSAATS